LDFPYFTVTTRTLPSTQCSLHASFIVATKKTRLPILNFANHHQLLKIDCLMSGVGMRLTVCCLAAWATVSQSSSTGLGTVPESEEAQKASISRGQIRDVDNEVDISREQKQHKWAFMPHNPSGFGERRVTNQEVGLSSSTSEDSHHGTQSQFAEAFPLDRDQTNVNRPSQALHNDGDPITSSEVRAVDDRTLLDVFAESAKEYLTTRLVSVYNVSRRG
jgi:hypothetical protein